MSAEHLLGLDHAGGRPGDVVFLRAEQARMLRSLTTEQRASGLGARRRDALHDRGYAFGYDRAASDVVGQEQRLRTADDQVVDQHADQVVDRKSTRLNS